MDTAPPSAELIRKYLDSADPNVLRLALLQLTGDPALARMRVDKVPIWAGALYTYVLAPEHHAEIKERALQYLIDAAAQPGTTHAVSDSGSRNHGEFRPWTADRPAIRLCLRGSRMG